MEQVSKKHSSLSVRFRNAWHGLAFFFLEDYKTTIPIIFIGILFAWLIEPTLIELMFIVLATGVGILFGMFNTIVEELCDLYSTAYNPKIKLIKDMSAGACVFYALVAGILLVLMVLPNHFLN